MFCRPRGRPPIFYFFPLQVASRGCFVCRSRNSPNSVNYEYIERLQCKYYRDALTFPIIKDKINSFANPPPALPPPRRHHQPSSAPQTPAAPGLYVSRPSHPLGPSVTRLISRATLLGTSRPASSYKSEWLMFVARLALNVKSVKRTEASDLCYVKAK
jgi:hypothetical protein